MTKFAARQHGIVDGRELLAAGVARATIGDWARSGRLFRLYPGIYSVVDPTMLTIEGRWLAAVKACGSGAFLSHGPSGQLQGIVPRRERHGLHVSLVARSARKPRGIIVHRPRALHARDTTKRLSIPTTTITRTIWDLASTVPSLQTRRAFEQATGRDRLDRLRLAQLLEASPNRKGSGMIRALLSERIVPLSEVRSWLEELLLTICADNGISFPAVNVPLLGYEVDFLWERERFVVEADGRDHLITRQRDEDNERDITLGRAGYLIRRYSSPAMARRAEIAREVLAILRERARLR